MADYIPPAVWTPPPAIVAKAEPVLKRISEPPVVVVRAGYPIRGGWWSGCNSWHHLATGEHRGKFPSAWLASLTWAELQSLHSDDHEGRVKWSHVPKGK